MHGTVEMVGRAARVPAACSSRSVSQRAGYGRKYNWHLNRCRSVRSPRLPLPSVPRMDQTYLRQVADCRRVLRAGGGAAGIRGTIRRRRHRGCRLFLARAIAAGAVAWPPACWRALTTPGSSASEPMSSGGSSTPAVCLTAAIAIVAYATKTEVARGYVVVSLPSLTAFDLLAGTVLRKRLHRIRALGNCMRRVVVVGHPDVIGELAAVLRRDTYHGLSVVAACVLGPDCPNDDRRHPRRRRPRSTSSTWCSERAPTPSQCWPARR